MDSQILYAVISGLFGIVVILISWLGNRTINKIDALSNDVSQLSTEVVRQMGAQDTRITRVEVTVENIANVRRLR